MCKVNVLKDVYPIYVIIYFTSDCTIHVTNPSIRKGTITRVCSSSVSIGSETCLVWQGTVGFVIPKDVSSSTEIVRAKIFVWPLPLPETDAVRNPSRMDSGAPDAWTDPWRDRDTRCRFGTLDVLPLLLQPWIDSSQISKSLLSYSVYEIFTL